MRDGEAMEQRPAAALPVVEYGHYGQLESRPGRVRWLLGGMLILTFVSALTMVAEVAATLLAIRLVPAGAVAGVIGGIAGVAIFIVLLVGLVYWASDPRRVPALLSADRPAVGSAVVICVVLAVVALAGIGARILFSKFAGSAAIVGVYQVQAFFYYLRALALPLGMVIAIRMSCRGG